MRFNWGLELASGGPLLFYFLGYLLCTSSSIFQGSFGGEYLETTPAKPLDPGSFSIGVFKINHS